MDAHEVAARRAAARAGEIIREGWAKRGSVGVKSSSIDLVTDIDRAAERAIIETIRQTFPDHAVLAEESGAQGESELRWIVDPLDGTTNFAHGYPQVSVSIALQSPAETLLGVVYDPLREELFVARRGGGAHLNERPLAVSTVGQLSESLLATGFPYDRRSHADFYLSFFREFMVRCHGIRRAGSAALDLCWVAAGRVEGFWEWKLQPWDTAAAALIVREAGGKTSDFAGHPFDPFGAQCLASNGGIHGEMLAVIGELL